MKSYPALTGFDGKLCHWKQRCVWKLDYCSFCSIVLLVLIRSFWELRWRMEQSTCELLVEQLLMTVCITLLRLCNVGLLVLIWRLVSGSIGFREAYARRGKWKCNLLCRCLPPGAVPCGSRNDREFQYCKKGSPRAQLRSVTCLTDPSGKNYKLLLIQNHRELLLR